MKTWYHIDCFFAIKKTKNSKTIACSGEIEGWDLLSEDDKALLIKGVGPDFKESSPAPNPVAASTNTKTDSKDNLFSEFQRIIDKVANEPSYNSKSQILHKFIREVGAHGIFGHPIYL